MATILGKYVLEDLMIDDIVKHFETETQSGSEWIKQKLIHPTTDVNHLKNIQKQLIQLRKLFRKNPKLKDSISCLRKTIKEQEHTLIDCMTNRDERILETIHQIIWSSDSIGAFLNSYGVVLDGIHNWKTIFLPGFSILAPLIAMIIPYVVFKYTYKIPGFTIDLYLEQLKHVILSQMSTPSFLSDGFGKLLYLGIALATFVSGLWNQVSSAIHLRHLASDLDSRGKKIQILIQSCNEISDLLKGKIPHVPSLPKEAYDSHPRVVYSSVFNNHNLYEDLHQWIGEIDGLLAIANKTQICFPNM